MASIASDHSTVSSSAIGGLVSSNGTSKWELTMYDQHRVPHEPVSDASEITVSPRSLSAELMCPICRDMLRNTMTTKECLHRFCHECITTALRNGNKECPICKKKLVSKRSLRPDPNFDCLIAKLYPNREEYDQMQEKAMLNLSQQNNTEALQRSIEEGIKYQAELRRQYKSQSSVVATPIAVRRKKKDLSPDVSSALSTPNAERREASAIQTHSSTMKDRYLEIQFILRPHPDLLMSEYVPTVVKQTRYMKTTSNATIDHLAEFLVTRIQLDCDELKRSNENLSFSSFIEKYRSSPENCSNQTTADVKVENHTTTVYDENKIFHSKQPAFSSTAIQTANRFTLYVAKGGLSSPSAAQLTELKRELTLNQILTKFWCAKKPLELHFSVSSTFLAQLLHSDDKGNDDVDQKTRSNAL